MPIGRLALLGEIEQPGGEVYREVTGTLTRGETYRAFDFLNTSYAHLMVEPTSRAAPYSIEQKR